MRYVFEEIKLQGKKRVWCPKCNKKYYRSTTFMETVNPFNKNKDGTPKSPSEIMESLKQKRADWEKVTCDDHHNC